ncbi:MAG: NrfD/PsrC family molybdoenzyme membrane anchor subunit [Terriglobia bacterium]
MPESREKTFQSARVLGGLFLGVGALSFIASFAMLETPAWGAFIASYIYFLGLTEGALVLGITFTFIRGTWSRTLYPLGGALTVSFFPLAVLMMLVIIASQGSIFYWADGSAHNMWLDPTFFTIRNLVVVPIVYLFGWLVFKNSLETTDPERDEKHQVRWGRLAVPFVLLFALHQGILSYDLGMTMTHHWVNTIFPPAFLVTSLRTALAGLVVVMFILRQRFKVNFVDSQFRNLGHLTLGLTIVWFYFQWCMFYPVWYANIPEGTEGLYLRIFNPEWMWTFALMMVFGGVIPFLMLVFHRTRRSVSLMVTVSSIILVGLWVERFLVAMPPLAEDHKSAHVAVFGFTNLTFGLGVLGAAILLFLAVAKRFPKVIAGEPSEG